MSGRSLRRLPVPLRALALPLGLGLVACASTGTPAAATPAGGADDAEGFRRERPLPGPTPTLQVPIPEHRVLENGLTVLVVPERELPLVHLSLLVRGGSAADPVELPGLAAFCGEALRSGTKSRTAEQIADEVETLGSMLHVETEEEYTEVSFTALRENFDGVFDVAADVLLHPAFAPEEMERLRREHLGALAERHDDLEQVASDLFLRTVYGRHPYGHNVLGTEASVKAIDARALRSFYETSVEPSRVAAVVVGDLDVDEAVQAVRDRFGAWASSRTELTPLSEPQPLPPAIVLYDRKNAPQSQLRIGHLGVPRSHPDFYPLILLNDVLGGTFNSRINMNLRENKGYTYGAWSVFDFRRTSGTFVVGSAVRTDATGPAISEVLQEITSMRRTGITAQELDDAQNRYELSLTGLFQSSDGIARMLRNIFIFDLPLDEYQRLPERIGAVTLADVQRVAETHLRPEQLSIVVVGDRTEVLGGLLELGRGLVTQVDADGSPR